MQATSPPPVNNLAGWFRQPGRLLSENPARTVLLASLCLFLPLSFAGLGLIDDHEIVRILTLFDDRKWAGIRDFLLSVDFGDLPRFRPTYYFLRVAESILFRDAALAWFAMRLLMVAAFAIATLKFADIFLSRRNALLVALGCLAAPFVPDVFMRLGPSESYAAALSALIIFAFVKRWPYAWLAASMCATLLAGVKESFLFLIPFQIYPIVIAVRRKQLVSTVAAACCLSISLAFLYVVVLKLIHAHAVDVYGNSIQSGRAISALHSVFASLRGIAALALFATSILVWNVERSRKTISAEALVLVPTGVLCLAFNAYFYGEIPSISGRYAFPFWWVFLMLSAYCGNILFLRSPPGLVKRWTSRALLISCIVAVCLGLARNSSRSYLYAVKTNQAQIGMQALKRFDIRLPVLVHASTTGDFEPVVSVSRFLDFYKGREAIRYLIVSPPFVPTNSAFQSSLNRQMMRKMHEGGDGYLPIPPVVPASNACIEAYFRQEVSPLCDARVLIPY